MAGGIRAYFPRRYPDAMVPGHVDGDEHVPERVSPSPPSPVTLALGFGQRREESGVVNNDRRRAMGLSVVWMVVVGVRFGIVEFVAQEAR